MSNPFEAFVFSPAPPVEEKESEGRTPPEEKVQLDTRPHRCVGNILIDFMFVPPKK